jgi:hypothetical protein
MSLVSKITSFNLQYLFRWLQSAAVMLLAFIVISLSTNGCFEASVNINDEDRDKILAGLSDTVHTFESIVDGLEKTLDEQRSKLSLDTQATVATAIVNLRGVTDQLHRSIEAINVPITNLRETFTADLRASLLTMGALAEELQDGIHNSAVDVINKAAIEIGRVSTTTLGQANQLVQNAIRPTVIQLREEADFLVGTVTIQANVIAIRLIFGGVALVALIGLILALLKLRKPELRWSMVGITALVFLGGVLSSTAFAEPLARTGQKPLQIPNYKAVCSDMSKKGQELDELLGYRSSQVEDPAPTVSPTLVSSAHRAEAAPATKHALRGTSRTGRFSETVLELEESLAPRAPRVEDPALIISPALLGSVRRGRAKASRATKSDVRETSTADSLEALANEVRGLASECQLRAPNVDIANTAHDYFVRASVYLGEPIRCYAHADCTAMNRPCNAASGDCHPFRCDTNTGECLQAGLYCESHADCDAPAQCDLQARRCVPRGACSTPADCRPEDSCHKAQGLCVPTNQANAAKLPCHASTPGLFGPCSEGIWVSEERWMACRSVVSATPEKCDGVDNDCNGTIDDGVLPINAGCTIPDAKGECQRGGLECFGGSGLVCTATVSPQPEICDNKDNNCDGVVDDHNPGGGGACYTDAKGECTNGTYECRSGALWCTRGKPVAEVCGDCKDNDCDGVADDHCRPPNHEVRAEHVGPFVADGGWGNWRELAMCPDGKWVTGGKVRIERSQGGDSDEDDTALNGVRLFCGSTELRPGDGFWGGWEDMGSCKRYVTGARLRIEPSLGGGDIGKNHSDDTGAVDLELICEDGQILGGATHHEWGSFKAAQTCPGGSAVCGVKTRIEPEQGGGKTEDDTAMNDLELTCCTIHKKCDEP